MIYIPLYGYCLMIQTKGKKFWYNCNTMTFQCTFVNLKKEDLNQTGSIRHCTLNSHSYHVRLQIHTPFPKCGVEITSGSTMAHWCRMHGMKPENGWNWLPVSQTDHHLQVYYLRFLQTTKRWPYPFSGCSGTSCMCNGLQSQFRKHNWGYSIRILEEQLKPLS